MADFDPTTVKLGKEPVKTDVRTLLLARYVDKSVLPEPPASVDLGDRVTDWPMYANDRVGDCTCAAAGHMIEAWTAEARGEAVEVSEADVLGAYEQVKVPDGDGAVELDVLNYWRSTGIGGHQVAAFARVPVYDHELVKTGTAVFGGAYIGVALPVSAQRQDVWDWAGDLSGPNAPRSWGGHAVDVVAYDPDTVTVVTWGSLKKMTWDFWDRYCEEAYCIVSQDFLENGKTPDGLDFDGLIKDLELVTA